MTRTNHPREGRPPANREPGGMRIGPVPFLAALVFAVLILIPWTRSLGIGLMLLLAIPICIGWVRARRLTDGSRGLTSANAVICGLMVVVGAAMSPGAGPDPIPTGTAAIAAPPPTTAPPIARVTTTPPATAAVSATPTTRRAPATAAQQPARAAVPRPAEVARAPEHATTPSTAAPSTAPSKARPEPPAAGCAGDSYINSSGHCVHRPEAAPSAPDGATARCEDRTYSFSEHRRGTCSGHGGVADWL